MYMTQNIAPKAEPSAFWKITLYTNIFSENIAQPIEMQLSKKPMASCHVFIAYLKSTSNFEQFEKKDEHLAFCCWNMRKNSPLQSPLCKHPL